MIRMDYQLNKSELDERVQKRINGSVIYSERDQYGRVDVMLVWHEPIPGGRGKTAEIREHIGEIDYKDRTVTYFLLSGKIQMMENTTSFSFDGWIGAHGGRPIDTRHLVGLSNGVVALRHEKVGKQIEGGYIVLEDLGDYPPPMYWEDGSYTGMPQWHPYSGFEKGGRK